MLIVLEEFSVAVGVEPMDEGYLIPDNLQACHAASSDDGAGVEDTGDNEVDVVEHAGEFQLLLGFVHALEFFPNVSDFFLHCFSRSSARTLIITQ